MTVTYRNHCSPLNINLHPDILTDDFTLTKGEIDSCVSINTSDACVVTLPDDDTLKVQIGLEVHLVQVGAGSISISLDPGVTVTDPFSTASPKFIRLKKSGLNDWLIVQSQ
jgi:hypothetical protein